MGLAARCIAVTIAVVVVGRTAAACSSFGADESRDAGADSAATSPDTGSPSAPDGASGRFCASLPNKPLHCEDFDGPEAWIAPPTTPGTTLQPITSEFQSAPRSLELLVASSSPPGSYATAKRLANTGGRVRMSADLFIFAAGDQANFFGFTLAPDAVTGSPPQAVFLYASPTSVVLYEEGTLPSGETTAYAVGSRPFMWPSTSWIHTELTLDVSSRTVSLALDRVPLVKDEPLKLPWGAGSLTAFFGLSYGSGAPIRILFDNVVVEQL